VILLGGATGVGKSTIATMLASRLGINRVIPTDAIREVMRSMLTPALFPTLHTSLFEVGRLVRTPLPTSVDPYIIGFREQTAAVTVGIEALVQRAVDEGTDLIVEGAHVVPGFPKLDRFAGKAVAVQLVVTVDEEETHRSHFLRRARESRNRPPERYLENFANIRKLQRYIKSLALQNGVPTVPSYSLDATLSQIIDLVVGQAFEAVPSESPPIQPTNPPNRQARAASVPSSIGASGIGSGGES
jgi:2-phosphoglycerate kinase